MSKTVLHTGEVTAAIKRAIEQLEDMTPIFRDVRDYMVRATRKRFTEGKDPDGKAWAPKSEATLARYKRLGYGELPKALIGPGRRLSREIKGSADRNGAVIGSSLIYSRVMQEGALKGEFGLKMNRGRVVPIPWGRIPARRWLGISDADELAILDIVDEHLEEKLKGG